MKRAYQWKATVATHAIEPVCVLDTAKVFASIQGAWEQLPQVDPSQDLISARSPGMVSVLIAVEDSTNSVIYAYTRPVGARAVASSDDEEATRGEKGAAADGGGDAWRCRARSL